MKREIEYEGERYRLRRLRTRIANIYCHVCDKCKLEQVYYESDSLRHICPDCAKKIIKQKSDVKLKKEIVYKGVKFKLRRLRTRVAVIYCCVCDKDKFEQVFYAAERILASICLDCAKKILEESSDSA